MPAARLCMGASWMGKTAVLCLAVLFGSHFLFAQDPDDAAQAGANSPAVAGKALFSQNCSFCHGPDARGASGPDLIRSTLVSHDVNGDLIGQVVHNGRPAKGMPAFQLSDDQIRDVAAFLHAQAQLASTVTRRMPSDYPLDKLLVGNADAGKAYFEGAGKCSQCHSPAGDLAHIASKYKPLELQSRIAFPSGENSTAVVTYSSGHQFQGEVAYSDEFLITLRSSDNTLRTFNRRGIKIQEHDPLAAHVALLDQYTDADIHNLLSYLETLK